MKAHIAEEEIALLAGDDIEATRRAKFELHLSGCRACLQLLDNYRKDREAMEALREEALPSADYTSVRESVLASIREGRGTARCAPTIGVGLRWLGLAAAILIAVAIGVWWMRISEPLPLPPVPPLKQQNLLVKPFISIAGPIRNPKATVSHPELAQARPRKSRGEASLHAADIVPSIPRSAERAPVLDDVVIKMETADPNVTIIWLSSPRGEGR